MEPKLEQTKNYECFQGFKEKMGNISTQVGYQQRNGN